MNDILDAIYEKCEGSHYGHYLAINCLFHDDTRPSLMVYPDYYRCLSCDAHGKTSDLLKKLDNTLLLLSNTTPDYRNPWSRWLKNNTLPKILKQSWQLLTSQPSLGNYMTGRGISPEWQRKLGIGYREDWYTIHIRNSGLKIVGAVARANAETNLAKAKYVIPSGQNTDLLYVPDWKLLQSSSEIYLTFGILDAITLVIIGKAAMSTTGGKRLNSSALDNFRKRIIIVPDFGETKEALCLAKELGWRGQIMNIDYPEGCKDANDLLTRQVIQRFFV